MSLGPRLRRYDARSILDYFLSHPEYLKNTAGRIVRPGDYAPMFYGLLMHQQRFARAGVAPWGSYYEFGVAGGRTLVSFLRAYRDFCRTNGGSDGPFHLVAFDSFQGLPAPESDKDARPGWTQGTFAHSLADVRARVDGSGLVRPDTSIRYVPGFYEQSLTPTLRDELRSTPPSIVMVDVDFFSSATTVLTWIRPLLRSGTLFYFDDVASFDGDPERGELAAIRAFNAVGPGQLVNYPVDVPMHALSPRYVYLVPHGPGGP